jgi:NAD(P)H-dependent FMN reductase
MVQVGLKARRVEQVTKVQAVAIQYLAQSLQQAAVVVVLTEAHHLVLPAVVAAAQVVMVHREAAQQTKDLLAARGVMTEAVVVADQVLRVQLVRLRVMAAAAQPHRLLVHL